MIIDWRRPQVTIVVQIACFLSVRPSKICNFLFNAFGFRRLIPNRIPIDAMLFLDTTHDNFDEVVSCIGDTSWLLSIAAEVVENSLARFTHFAKVIRMASGAESQYSIELDHISPEKLPIGIILLTCSNCS